MRAGTRLGLDPGDARIGVARSRRFRLRAVGEQHPGNVPAPEFVFVGRPVLCNFLAEILPRKRIFHPVQIQEEDVLRALDPM